MMQRWLCMQEWKALIDLIQTDPYARDVTILDPLNEPDAHGLGWNAVGPFYEQLAAYAYSVNPSVLPCSMAACNECQHIMQTLHLLGRHTDECTTVESQRVWTQEREAVLQPMRLCDAACRQPDCYRGDGPDRLGIQLWRRLCDRLTGAGERSRQQSL